jgi:hypothetical protein
MEPTEEEIRLEMIRGWCDDSYEDTTKIKRKEESTKIEYNIVTSMKSHPMLEKSAAKIKRKSLKKTNF